MIPFSKPTPQILHAFRFGSTGTFPHIIRSLTARFSTQEELQDLQDFMAANPDQGTGGAAYQQAVEATKANIAWRDMHEDNIVTWLNDKNNS